MTEKDWKYIDHLIKELEELKQLKRINIEAVQKYYRTENGTGAQFPSVCKQPMTDILVTYYNLEIAKVQAKIDAIAISFGRPENITIVCPDYPDPRTQKETGPMTKNTNSQSDSPI